MRLTLREQEIINVLKKNPLISQDDLAQIFGITRSSIAVHISNLMKKGIIRGKGYVFNEEASVVILGECFLEININHEGSSDSSIDIKYRGTPIELSSIFCSYGIKPEVLTFIGNDEVGRFFLCQLKNLEINLTNIHKHHKRTDRRVYINNELAFFENMTEEDYQKAISAREWVIFNCDWLVMEYKFAQEMSIRALNKNEDNLPCLCTYKVLEADEKLPDYLSQYTLLVLGVEVMSANDKLISRLMELNTYPEQIFIITDGKSEIIVVNKNRNYNFPLLPNQNFSIYNQLSFFLAGLIYGSLNKHSLRQVIRIAIGTTGLTQNKNPEHNYPHMD